MQQQKQPRKPRPPKPPQKQPRTVPAPKGNYAFIDSQNLNLGVQKIGWKMDWKRFRQWLADKHGVTHAFMFIGYMADNESLYELMHEHGYLVVLKPTLEVRAHQTEEQIRDGEEQKSIVKGNIDADLVLYAMKEYANYDKAVLVSGDGDFFGLVEYLANQGKLHRLLTPNQRYSTLLKPFDSYIEGLDTHRGELAYHDRPRGRRLKSTRQ